MAELWGELEDVVRFVVIKITQKKELDSFMLHFQEMKIDGNVVVENSFSLGIWFAIDPTKNKNFHLSL